MNLPKCLAVALAMVLVIPTHSMACDTANPYYNQSAYVNAERTFEWCEILVDGNLISNVSENCFSEGNVCYIPLRATLEACGVHPGDIIWDDGSVTIKLSENTLKIAVNSDTWLLNGESQVTLNGHVQLRDGTTFVPKDTVEEWCRATDAACLNRLLVRAYYSCHGGGLIEH